MRGLQPGVIAVSGGIDSRFLWAAACRFELDFQPVFLVGPHMTASETEWAKGVLGRAGHVLTVDPLAHPAVRQTQISRCFHCKYESFAKLRAWGLAHGRPWVLEGSQESDGQAFRPGRRALRFLGIKSPLADVGLSKTEVREIARDWALDWPDQPSRPCLLTRFAYETVVTYSALRRVEAIEDRLFRIGLRYFRVRVVPEAPWILQITAEETEVFEHNRTAIADVFAAHGNSPWRLERTATLSGYFDRP